MTFPNQRTGISTLFIDAHGRLRSGIRFGVFVTVFVLALLLFGSVGVLVLTAVGRAASADTPIFLLVNGLSMLVAALLTGWLAAAYLEKLPFRSLGASFTAQWVKNLSAGLIIGAITLTVAVGIAAIGGGLSFELQSTAGAQAILRTMAVSALIFLVAAAAEEALFRGYILQTFSRSGLAAFGVLVTSVMFAMVHNANPNATLLSWINTFLAGVWFGIAYLRTRDLWFVTGLHMAWNWMQGAFFGIEVSGLTELIAAPLFREIDTGPEWLTGGDYGIEGGVAATIALLLSIAAVRFVPFLWPEKELLSMTSPPAARGDVIRET